MSDMAKAVADSHAKQFAKLHEMMWAMCGSDTPWYAVTPEIDCEWTIMGDSDIIFGEPPLDNEECCGGEIYGTSVWRGKYYTIVVYDDGCGSRKNGILLDNSKEIKE